MSTGEKQTKSNRWVVMLGIALVLVVGIGIVLAAVYWINRSQGSGPADTLTPTQAAPVDPGPIVIQSFSVDKERIVAGECVNLSWVVENAELIQLKRDSALSLDQAPASHTYSDCLEQPGIFLYRLEAENSAGFYNWVELQVIVDPQ